MPGENCGYMKKVYVDTNININVINPIDFIREVEVIRNGNTKWYGSKKQRAQHSFQGTGEANAIRFLSQIRYEKKDYLAIQDKLFKGMSVDEIFDKAKKHSEGYSNQISHMEPITKRRTHWTDKKTINLRYFWFLKLCGSSRSWVSLANGRLIEHFSFALLSGLCGKNLILFRTLSKYHQHKMI